MLGLIDHGAPGWPNSVGDSCYSHNQDETYETYFGLGQSLELIHTPQIFNVSLAGLRLGSYLVRTSDHLTLTSSFLDMGTGSGIHALLMRKLGNEHVAATDISKSSIKQAKIHESINFTDEKISFHVSDLFESIPKERFHTILFNPPGWRTPSNSLLDELRSIKQQGQIPTRAMFYGNEVVTRFLDELPAHLSKTGRAIIGLNSLVGIRDILKRYHEKHQGVPPLSYKLIERHTFPLLYYSAQWRMISDALKNEFENWRKKDLAAYSTDQHGNIYWSYEIVEFFHRKV